jgi:hypothetical protein
VLAGQEKMPTMEVVVILFLILPHLVHLQVVLLRLVVVKPVSLDPIQQIVRVVLSVEVLVVAHGNQIVLALVLLAKEMQVVQAAQVVLRAAVAVALAQ